VSLLVRHVAFGIRCDIGLCPERITGDEMPIYLGEPHYEQLAREAGWSVWVGRTRRFYCPAHGPSKGSSMRPEVATPGG
jgi:hypothetical protein